MKLESIKSRIEAYIALIVIVGGAGTAVVVNIGNIGEEAKTDRALIKRDITSMKAAQDADDQADAQLLEAKLEPIADLGKELKLQLAIVKANLDGLSIAAAQGDSERARLLEGRLVVLQNQMYNVTMGQQAFMDSLTAISREIDLLRVQTDTVVVVTADTLYMDKNGKWWNPFD